VYVERLAEWPRDAAAREALRADWSGLLARCDHPGIFQHHDWLEAWWQSFGTGCELVLLLVRDGRGELQAIAPFMVVAQHRFGMRQRRLLLVGTANAAADYADLIVARGNARARVAIRQWLVARRNEWTSIELYNVPEHSPTLSLLDGAERWRRPLVQFAAEAPARRLGDAEADRQMLAKKSLRRHVNGFRRDGQLDFVRLTGRTEVDRQLDAFFEQHVQRWAGTGTPSLFEDPSQRRFYRALVERLDPAGPLHFSVVLFDARPIAFHFGFEFDGVFTWYKPTFDPALQKRSPGEVLIRCLLEDAVGRGLREFDFTVGSESFKYRFATVVRRVYRVRLYRRAWEHLPALARDALKRLLPRLRRVGLRPSPGAAPSAEGTRPARSA
jgi:CelD/BcsL family acetyltransferase involved in cellulose biosynthesis